jgi:hypothetical protein
VGWVNLVLERGKWQDLVDTVMKLQFHKLQGVRNYLKTY